ncbi:MAG: serine/threonine-protein kinase [Planctomycetes bacterium]|jgi:serine/threonine protein kinase/tetratricopeptide (TPR) repeat protein|nr:serine/threonine-protein kinase [Planctomycetota bacterium]
MNEFPPARLRELFEAGHELPPGERAAFVASHCDGQPLLAQRLLAMFASLDQDSFLALPAASAPPLEGPGTVLGPYELLELVGEGGFGVVYRAAQHRPVVREVALKILKPGMDTREVTARFEQERQALARMDHPHIARVLDAGSTASGRPFFVMEFVAGEPIVGYCDRRRLSIAARLELFDQVCRAVQHAHGKGIIHRDLKPSNVLVTEADGRPHGKVIDFGIAKAIAGSGLGASLELTAQRQVLGTLQYMSPEQAEGAADLDTRTDVYSLGVMLYELLTGSTPFRRDELERALFADLRQLLRDQEPPRPSTRITTAADAATVAAQRCLAPRRLSSLLRGDLDWIVMKALEKEPARRYATVDALAADLAAHLAGDPVVAAPPSAGYRLRKLVRRHRRAVVSAGAVVLSLLVGLLAFAYQARATRLERDAARTAQTAEAAQRTAAERSADEAAAINRFLREMLGAAKVRELGREAKVVDALDHAAAKVGRAFEARPAVAGAVHLVLANSYLSLGQLQAAEAQLAAARPLVAAAPGEPSLPFVELLTLTGDLCRQRGDDAGSLAALQQAHTMAQQLPGGPPAGELQLRLDLGNAAARVGEHALAESCLRSALTDALAQGSELPVTQVARNSLAVWLHGRGRLDEAERLYREAVAVGERVLGPDHVDTLTARMNLAAVLRARHQYAAAEPILLAAAAGLQRVYGDEHTTTGDAVRALGVFYQDTGRWAEAVPWFERSIAIQTRQHGAASEAVAEVQAMLAQCMGRIGQADRMVELLEACLANRSQRLGATAAMVMILRVQLANALLATARRADGEAMLRELPAQCEQALGPDAPATIIATNSRAVRLLAERDHAAALPLLERALAAGRRSPHADPRDTVITQLNLAAALRELGRLDEAEQHGREACAELVRVYGPEHPTTAAGRSRYAEILSRLRRLPEAKDQLQQAIAITRRNDAVGQPSFGEDAIALARVHLDSGELELAESCLQDTENVYRQRFGAEHRVLTLAELERGRLLARRQQWAAAVALLEPLAQRLETGLPASRRDHQRACRALVEVYTAWHAAAPAADRAAAAALWQQRAQ